ncbi:hypothetical protein KKA93_02720 [Patescibacteria group bacterium]|nr:hypothetical protein [Patescibacteria group bacterium]MBU1663738.1 hypothetical protein [Patescibacteria group bacterium]MBU1934290.1 hypothetical protein [Patescibacteria group bacterium]MBU2007719.1 hypothetical protein [Patescibacteria group bacterium]MBU2233531.1 hypothetical protein [Patescibacteria group bacterium]
MKKLLITILISFLFFPIISFAETKNLAQKLFGRILLQVQSKGEAWYVNPADQKRYYLGRPSDAFNIMKKIGLGVKHKIITNYKIYPASFLGKILIDVENNGKAYYINPTDKKAYYLGRPDDAFVIMKKLSLGITNENLNQISIGQLPPIKPTDNLSIMEQAAIAIRNNDQSKIKPLFSPSMEKIIEYGLNYLDAEGRLTLANILSSSSLISSTDDQKIYSTKVYFSLGGYEVPVKFYVQKQPDNKWLITNL